MDVKGENLTEETAWVFLIQISTSLFPPNSPKIFCILMLKHSFFTV